MLFRSIKMVSGLFEANSFTLTCLHHSSLRSWFIPNNYDKSLCRLQLLRTL